MSKSPSLPWSSDPPGAPRSGITGEVFETLLGMSWADKGFNAGAGGGTSAGTEIAGVASGGTGFEHDHEHKLGLEDWPRTHLKHTKCETASSNFSTPAEECSAQKQQETLEVEDSPKAQKLGG